LADHRVSVLSGIRFFMPPLSLRVPPTSGLRITWPPPTHGSELPLDSFLIRLVSLATSYLKYRKKVAAFNNFYNCVLYMCLVTCDLPA
jgi:hypothetical protein